MKYAKLGNTDIEVSKLCVGCMGFGKPFKDFREWTLSQSETDEVVRHILQNIYRFSISYKKSKPQCCTALIFFI